MPENGCKSFVAVSDRYHLARIGYLKNLQKWGTLDTYPSDISSGIKFEILSVIRESFAFIYYIFAETVKMFVNIDNGFMSIGY